MEKYISAFQADAAGKDARDASTVNGVKGSDVYLFFFFSICHWPELGRPTLSAKETYKCRGEDRCLGSSNFFGPIVS